MERISSASNETLKLLRGLTRKKNRQQSGLFLAEGERLIREAISYSWHIEHLVFSETALEDPSHNSRLMELSQHAERSVKIPLRFMEKLSTKANSAKVIGGIMQQEPPLPGSIGRGLWIALWEVRDPGNLGTIIRTADCIGASGIILLGDCCDPFSTECVRASMGSIFALPPIQTDFAAFEVWRRRMQLDMYGASMHGTKSPDKLDLTGPHCWLMGNEQAGLPKDIENACEALVRIPMRDGADSFNLAQATTILTYESWRQRGFA